MKTVNVSWWCNCRAPPNPCPATVVQKGQDFIFGKKAHSCKAKLDKSLHAEMRSEVKKEVKSNIYATTAQVVEPIFSKHFEKDPERNLPVLDNIMRVARRAKSQMAPKNPLDMDFDLSNFFTAL
jgi:hypothetical protein